MKKFKTPILTLALISAVLFSCNKSEISTGDYAETEAISVDSSMVISDSISSVASLNVKDKQFIKTASVEMEVKDVYETTISVEKFLVTIGGFVTSSQLNSQILSEETYNTSDENAMFISNVYLQSNVYKQKT
jgi:predicted ATP-dependent protease